jgi:hypothetical protein
MGHGLSKSMIHFNTNDLEDFELETQSPGESGLSSSAAFH